MASTTNRPTAEQVATTFSYAQAAKGRTASVAPTSTTQSSQAASGTNTPSRDAVPSVNAPSSASQVLGESESSKVLLEEVKGSNSAMAVNSSESDTSGSKSSAANASSSPSSPSFGTSSVSTLPKEEEIPSTLTVAPEQGGWERRPQNSSSAGNTIERYAEAPEGRRGKGKRAANKNNKDSDKKEPEKEKEPAKPEAPLVAAPMPAVNIWAQRIEAAAKAKPATPAVAKVEIPSVNGGTSAAKPAEQKRRGKADDNEKTGQTGTGKEGTKNQKKSGDVRRDEAAGKRAAPRGSRTGEKDEKSVPTQLPPSVDDAASWPTPDTVVEGEKRKTQEKAVKDDDNEDSSNKEKRAKETWTKIPFTPSAVFSTPLPTRGRGNRGGGGARGGRDAGGRGGHMSNGNAGGEKASASALANVSNNEGKEQRGRDNASAGRAASLPPQTSKRASSDDPNIGRDQRKQSNAHEKAKLNAAQSAKVEQTPFDSESRRQSIIPGNGAPMEFLPGAEFHQAQQQGAMIMASDRFNPAEGFGQPGRDRRSESNTRSIDGYNGGGGFTQQRADSRADRGGRYRGRGNQSNFANGQTHLPAAFQNGHPLQIPNPFPVRQQGPYSPPINQSQYVPAYGAPSRGRGGRGHSMSGNMYGRYNGVNGHHMSPIQTTGPMFGGYPSMESMSAPPPFNPYVDQFNMVLLVRAQLEYYFSVDNLCKDVYLRKHMDSQGFVYLSFIANFSRMKKLTSDLELIRYAAEQSESIELAQGNDGIDRLRARIGWDQWFLPMDQRDASAKNAGPAQLTRPKISRQSFDAQLQMHQEGLAFSPNGMDPVYQPFPMPQTAMPPMNGHGNGVAHHQEAPLSATVPSFAPSVPPPTEDTSSLEAETTFKDEEVESLTVVVGSLGKSSFASSRTFSHGSISDYFSDSDSRRGRAGTNGTSDTSSPMTARRSISPATSLSSAEGNVGPTILWVKGREQATAVTSEVQNRTDKPYIMFRATALRHRDASHLGHTDHNMKDLYDFWSHFLIRNFNSRMYTEFYNLALEDAYQRQTNVGILHLITYYDHALKSERRTIPEALAEHYVQVVKQERGNEERPGFMKLRAAWKNEAIDKKSRMRIDKFVDAQLREELER